MAQYPKKRLQKGVKSGENIEMLQEWEKNGFRHYGCEDILHQVNVCFSWKHSFNICPQSFIIHIFTWESIYLRAREDGTNTYLGEQTQKIKYIFS